MLINDIVENKPMKMRDIFKILDWINMKNRGGLNEKVRFGEKVSAIVKKDNGDSKTFKSKN